LRHILVRIEELQNLALHKKEQKK